MRWQQGRLNLVPHSPNRRDPIIVTPDDDVAIVNWSKPLPPIEVDARVAKPATACPSEREECIVCGLWQGDHDAKEAESDHEFEKP
jgi:hypothetical protein